MNTYKQMSPIRFNEPSKVVKYQAEIDGDWQREVQPQESCLRKRVLYVHYSKAVVSVIPGNGRGGGFYFGDAYGKNYDRYYWDMLRLSRWHAFTSREDNLSPPNGNGCGGTFNEERF